MRAIHLVGLLVCFGWVIGRASAAGQAVPATAAAGEVRRFEFDNAAATRSAAFSPDGKFVVSVDHLPYQCGVVRVWDVATGREVRKWTPDDADSRAFDPHGAAFSPDGRRVLAFGWGKDAMRLWDAGTGDLVRRFPGGERGTSAAAFSPDGRRVVAGIVGEYSSEPSATLAMWDVAEGKRLHDFNGIKLTSAQAVAFTPDGRKVVAGSKGLRIFDADTGRLESEFDGPVCYRIALSPDGTRALTCGSGPADLWDLKAGKVVRRLTWKPGDDPDRSGFVEGAEAIDAVFLPGPAGHDRAVTASFKGPMVWDLTSGKPTSRFQAHRRYAHRVAASPDGRTALTFADDAAIRLWDIARQP